MRWQDQVVYHSLTDVGIKRSHNQDAYGVVLASNEETWLARGHIFVVADGMGAHAVGELASKMAVDTIQIAYKKLRELDPLAAIREAITEANEVIHERGRQNREFEGMGTTATTLVLMPDGARIGHVGDSRCYRIRGPAIEQLSFDHSLQWEMAKRRNVEPEHLKSVPRNVIVRSLGPEPRVRVDVHGPYPIRAGDQFLLCSDGLSGPVKDKEIWAAATFLPGAEAVQFLVDLANLRGGVDNITAVLVRLGDPAALGGGRSGWRRYLSASFWRDRFRHVPLTAWFLCTGLAMASIGYVLGETGLRGVFIALLALLLMSAGLAIMVINRQRRQRSPAPKACPPAPPPVYRSSTCWLDRTLIEELAATESGYRELALEEKWKIDWPRLQQIRQEAEAELASGQLTESLRAYCRLLSLLAEGMKTARDKQEVFRPNFQSRDH